MSVTCVQIYGLMFRILTRFQSLYFGASCIHRNSIVWRRVILARFPYWLEKRLWVISWYSYLLKRLISSEYDLTISGHVTLLRPWPLEKNTDYIILNICDECGDTFSRNLIPSSFGLVYVGHPISSATSLITWKRKMDRSSNIIIYLL